MSVQLINKVLEGKELDEFFERQIVFLKDEFVTFISQFDATDLFHKWREFIRTAWLYSEFGKNFCKTMLNLTATKPALKVVFDQAGTPTYALDLANAIVTILQKPQVGVFQFSNEGVCSWYDFTQMIAKIAGHTACDIQPCYSSEYPSPVTRPSYSVLDKRTIKETFGVKVPYWVDSLEKCIFNIRKNGCH